MDDEHSLVAQLAKLNACCHTLTDAIARLAYGSDYDGRYNGPGDRLWTEADARALRERDENYPTNAKLPGASVFSGLGDEAALTAAITAWEADDRKKWAEAAATVQSALRDGEIKTLDEWGNATPPEFWLANKLRGRRGRERQDNLLLRVCDVSYLVHKKETNESKSFRGKMIARFINRQLRVWRWINFADIADYCAREPGSINPDPALMASTFKQLGDALAKGEFETDRRTRVIFLDASVPWFKMTQARFEGIPSGSRDAFYLKSCWIPQELCRRWFGARRIAPPPWLPIAVGSEPLTVEPQTASSELRQATDNRIHQIITSIYDRTDEQNRKPPNVREISAPVQRELNQEGLTAARRRIQELAGNARHKDRRRRAGARLYGSLLPFSTLET